MNFEMVARRLGTAAIAKLTANLLSWIATILLLRWLTPSDYGIVAIAAIIADFFFQFLDSSVSADIVRRTTFSKRRAQYYAGSLVFLGVVAGILLSSLGPMLSSFYNAPGLNLIVVAKGLELVVSSILVVPEARLLRALDTKMQAILIFTSTVVASAIALFCAWSGLGLWSLIIGPLALRLCKLFLITTYRPMLLVKPKLSFSVTLRMVLLNRGLIVNRMSYIFYEYIPTLISGRVMGSTQTGLYFTAYDLASIPSSRMMNIVNQVALPVYSRLQSDKTKFESAVLRGTSLMTLVYWPSVVGLAAISDVFVALVLGPKWSGIPTILSIMAVAWAIRSPWDFLENPMIAAKHEKLLTQMQMVRIVVLVISCLILGKYGAIGYASAFLITSTLSAVLSIFISCPVLGVTSRKVSHIILRGSLCCVIMFMAVRISLGFVNSSGIWTKFLIGIFSGAISYCFASFFVQRSSVKDFMQLILHGFAKRKTVA